MDHSYGYPSLRRKAVLKLVAVVDAITKKFLRNTPSFPYIPQNSIHYPVNGHGLRSFANRGSSEYLIPTEQTIYRNFTSSEAHILAVERLYGITGKTTLDELGILDTFVYYNCVHINKDYDIFKLKEEILNFFDKTFMDKWKRSHDSKNDIERFSIYVDIIETVLNSKNIGIIFSEEYLQRCDPALYVSAPKEANKNQKEINLNKVLWHCQTLHTYILDNLVGKGLPVEVIDSIISLQTAEFWDRCRSYSKEYDSDRVDMNPVVPYLELLKYALRGDFFVDNDTFMGSVTDCALEIAIKYIGGWNTFSKFIINIANGNMNTFDDEKQIVTPWHENEFSLFSEQATRELIRVILFVIDTAGKTGIITDAVNTCTIAYLIPSYFIDKEGTHKKKPIDEEHATFPDIFQLKSSLYETTFKNQCSLSWMMQNLVYWLFNLQDSEGRWSSQALDNHLGALNKFYQEQDEVEILRGNASVPGEIKDDTHSEKDGGEDEDSNDEGTYDVERVDLSGVPNSRICINPLISWVLLLEDKERNYRQLSDWIKSGLKQSVSLSTPVDQKSLNAYGLLQLFIKEYMLKEELYCRCGADINTYEEMLEIEEENNKSSELIELEKYMKTLKIIRLPDKPVKILNALNIQVPDDKIKQHPTSENNIVIKGQIEWSRRNKMFYSSIHNDFPLEEKLGKIIESLPHLHKKKNDEAMDEIIPIERLGVSESNILKACIRTIGINYEVVDHWSKEALKNLIERLNASRERKRTLVSNMLKKFICFGIWFNNDDPQNKHLIGNTVQSEFEYIKQRCNPIRYFIKKYIECPEPVSFYEHCEMISSELASVHRHITKRVAPDHTGNHRKEEIQQSIYAWERGFYNDSTASRYASINMNDSEYKNSDNYDYDEISKGIEKLQQKFIAPNEKTNKSAEHQRKNFQDIINDQKDDNMPKINTSSHKEVLTMDDDTNEFQLEVITNTDTSENNEVEQAFYNLDPELAKNTSELVTQMFHHRIRGTTFLKTSFCGEVKTEIWRRTLLITRELLLSLHLTENPNDTRTEEVRMLENRAAVLEFENKSSLNFSDLSISDFITITNSSMGNLILNNPSDAIRIIYEMLCNKVIDMKITDKNKNYWLSICRICYILHFGLMENMTYYIDRFLPNYQMSRDRAFYDELFGEKIANESQLLASDWINGTSLRLTDMTVKDMNVLYKQSVKPGFYVNDIRTMNAVHYKPSVIRGRMQKLYKESKVDFDYILAYADCKSALRLLFSVIKIMKRYNVYSYLKSDTSVDKDKGNTMGTDSITALLYRLRKNDPGTGSYDYGTSLRRTLDAVILHILKVFSCYNSRKFLNLRRILRRLIYELVDKRRELVEEANWTYIKSALPVFSVINPRVLHQGVVEEHDLKRCITVAEEKNLHFYSDAPFDKKNAIKFTKINPNSAGPSLFRFLVAGNAERTDLLGYNSHITQPGFEKTHVYIENIRYAGICCLSSFLSLSSLMAEMIRSNIHSVQNAVINLGGMEQNTITDLRFTEPGFRDKNSVHYKLTEDIIRNTANKSEVVQSVIRKNLQEFVKRIIYSIINEQEEDTEIQDTTKMSYYSSIAKKEFENLKWFTKSIEITDTRPETYISPTDTLFEEFLVFIIAHRGKTGFRSEISSQNKIQPNSVIKYYAWNLLTRPQNFEYISLQLERYVYLMTVVLSKLNVEEYKGKLTYEHFIRVLVEQKIIPSSVLKDLENMEIDKPNTAYEKTEINELNKGVKIIKRGEDRNEKTLPNSKDTNSEAENKSNKEIPKKKNKQNNNKNEDSNIINVKKKGKEKKILKEVEKEQKKEKLSSKTQEMSKKGSSATELAYDFCEEMIEYEDKGSDGRKKTVMKKIVKIYGFSDTPKAFEKCLKYAYLQTFPDKKSRNENSKLEFYKSFMNNLRQGKLHPSYCCFRNSEQLRTGRETDRTSDRNGTPYYYTEEERNSVISKKCKHCKKYLAF